MNELSTPQNDVALRILKAADELMAREGMHNLSTHKIAKEAGVSVGTIYLYFKDKETLLNQLVFYLFGLYQAHMKRVYDPNLPLFQQYQSLWRATLQFMQENPTALTNVHQYESLPSYRTLVRSCIDGADLIWNKFISSGKKQGIIIDLDQHILYALTMSVAWEIMQQQMILEQTYSDEVIDEIILRTWKAITF